jgi:SAM-dependent methyltransferase
MNASAEPSSTGAPARLARYYDLDLEDDPGDLPLYLALAARTGGPILELGAGSGRLAVPLAAAGYDVTAVDLDPAMLARAGAAWQRRRRGGPGHTAGGTSSPRVSPSGRGQLRLVEADATALHLTERFALAILALNTLLLLEDPERQLAALRALAEHLRPGGLAAIDVWLPGPGDLSLYDGRLLLEWLRDDPETGDKVAKLASAQFDSATATVTLTQMFDAWAPDGGLVSRVARCDRLRLVGAAELVRMARDSGLEVETLAGDHRMGPFGPGEERAILIGRLV